MRFWNWTPKYIYISHTAASSDCRNCFTYCSYGASNKYNYRWRTWSLCLMPNNCRFTHDLHLFCYWRHFSGLLCYISGPSEAVHCALHSARGLQKTRLGNFFAFIKFSSERDKYFTCSSIFSDKKQLYFFVVVFVLFLFPASTAVLLFISWSTELA